MSDLRIQLLGGLAVHRRLADGTEVELDLGGPRPRRLLAALVLAGGRPVAPDRLVELVWGDDAPPSARATLQAYISKLRTQLEPARRAGSPPSVLATRPGGYALEVEPAAVDAFELLARLDRGIEAARAARPDEAVAVLGPIVGLVAPVLPELAPCPFAVDLDRRLALARRAAVSALASARLATGDPHGAEADLRAALDEDPRAEHLWRLLALATYRAGRPSDAVAVVAEARRTIGELTGLSIGPDLVALEAELLAHAPSLQPTGSQRQPRGAQLDGRGPTLRRSPVGTEGTADPRSCPHHRRPARRGHAGARGPIDAAVGPRCPSEGGEVVGTVAPWRSPASAPATPSAWSPLPTSSTTR